MVSQPDTATALTLRGPSSVVSRPSYARSSRSSRSKRYNRSHAGASTYVPQNEFPVFSQTGDVEIFIQVAGFQSRYLLHRHTLTRCSGFFEASTSQEWSRALPLPEAQTTGPAGVRNRDRDHRDNTSAVAHADASPHNPRKRWRYELDRGSGLGDVPMLVQKNVDRSKDGDAASNPTTSLFGGRDVGDGGDYFQNHATASAPGGRARNAGHGYSTSGQSNFSPGRSAVNLGLLSSATPGVAGDAGATPSSSSGLSQSEVDLFRDYDNLFRIFYNYHPILDGVNVADAYVQCKSLLTLADQYDALAVVGPRVDHHLLQFQSRLWKQIAKYPISYLRIGYLAHSKVIFQEALIHVVGQWPAGERSLRAALPDVVLDIIEDKVDELEEIMGRVESRLFRLGLTTSRGERVSPATSYLDWLAISFFRQWLADNTSPSSTPQAEFRDHRSTSSENGGRHHSELQLRNQAPPPAAPPLATLGRAYRTLGTPNPSAYLGHDECKRFLKLTPEFYSRENLRRFEKRIDELKVMARDLVRPLMGSALELDLGNGSRTADCISYLTCTTVGDRDLPWYYD